MKLAIFPRLMPVSFVLFSHRDSGLKSKYKKPISIKFRKKKLKDSSYL